MIRNIIIGLIIGGVVGIVLGVTFVAPRLERSPAMVAAGNAPVPKPEGREQPAKAGFKDAPVRPVVQLKMASAFNTEIALFGNLAKRIETEIRRVSAGQIVIELHQPNALVAVDDTLEAIGSSSIDAAFSSPGLWARKVPALQIYGGVPFGPAIDEYLAWLDFGGGRELLEEIYHKHRAHAVICGLTAPDAFGWFRRELNDLGDFRGLHIQIDGLGAKVLARLGAKTRSLSGGAIFTALETGKIDAVSFSMPSVDIRLGFQEYAKHYYFPGWQRPTTLLELLINLDKWNKLDAVHKAQIESVCADNIRYALAETESAQFGALKELYAGGVELHRLSPEMLDGLERTWQEVATQNAAADADFKRVWQSLKNFRTEYGIWGELSRP